MNARRAAPLLVLALLLSGCLGSQTTPPTPGNASPTAEGNRSEPSETRYETNRTNVPEIFPHNASWIEDEVRGNLSLRVTVEPEEASVCGIAQGAAGATDENLVGLVLLDPLRELWGAAVVGDGRVEAAGDLARVQVFDGTWHLELASQAEVDEPFSLFLSVFHAGTGPAGAPPAVQVEVGCSAPFELNVEAGSRETVPVGSGEFGGQLGASLAGAQATLALDNGREQTANRTVVFLGQTNRSSGWHQEGRVEVETPGPQATRELSGERMEPIRLEAGPGRYRMDAREVSSNAHLVGVVAGLNPVGDSLADLDAWARENVTGPAS